MSRFNKPTDTAPVPFTLPGGCLCEGSPHEADIVFFHAALTIEGGAAAQGVIRRAQAAGIATFVEQVEREMAWALTVTGIVSWNFLDDDGKPVPVSEQAIRALDWGDTAQYLVDHASTLYAEAAFVPFQRRLSSYSERRQTGGSTSPNRSTRKPRQTRSRPSSPTTTADTRPSSA